MEDGLNDLPDFGRSQKKWKSSNKWLKTWRQADDPFGYPKLGGFTESMVIWLKEMAVLSHWMLISGGSKVPKIGVNHGWSTKSSATNKDRSLNHIWQCFWPIKCIWCFIITLSMGGNPWADRDRDRRLRRSLILKKWQFWPWPTAMPSWRAVFWDWLGVVSTWDSPH